MGWVMRDALIMTDDDTVAATTGKEGPGGNSLHVEQPRGGPDDGQNAQLMMMSLSSLCCVLLCCWEGALAATDRTDPLHITLFS